MDIGGISHKSFDKRPFVQKRCTPWKGEEGERRRRERKQKIKGGEGKKTE